AGWQARTHVYSVTYGESSQRSDNLSSGVTISSRRVARHVRSKRRICLHGRKCEAGHAAWRAFRAVALLPRLHFAAVDERLYALCRCDIRDTALESTSAARSSKLRRDDSLLRRPAAAAARGRRDAQLHLTFDARGDPARDASGTATACHDRRHAE